MSLNNVVRTAIRRNARWLLRLTALIAFLLHGCGNDLIPLEEAKNKHYAIRVENVDFDLPLLYHPLEGSRKKGWEPPNSKRETVDAIKIVA